MWVIRVRRLPLMEPVAAVVAVVVRTWLVAVLVGLVERVVLASS